MSWDKPGSKSIFASHLTREKSTKESVPGPGAYSTPDVGKLRPQNRRTDVFVSTGPGAYNPDTIENDWNRPTYNITIATQMERRLT
ncbi:hypothetical protein ACHHYP_20337 [Achlya hypogyna]|uniref:Uncharacterized protein n=1 Tax=Achlya hypogyna TaxID=1202772 RepID=A0A1V9ZM30_ACHHY|nr:hypothetical protein ACHHYP_20337 [Achlya hypogyna]